MQFVKPKTLWFINEEVYSPEVLKPRSVSLLKAELKSINSILT